jgi:hypothetical protein
MEQGFVDSMSLEIAAPAPQNMLIVEDDSAKEFVVNQEQPHDDVSGSHRIASQEEAIFESPSRGQVLHLPCDDSFAQRRDSQVLSGDSEFENEKDVFTESADASVEPFCALSTQDVEDGPPVDIEASVVLQQVVKQSRKKVTLDARYTAVFEIISSLLDLPGGADVQKKFLADVRLLSELTSFLDRPASSKLIFSWGHLSDADVLGHAPKQSHGKSKNKSLGMASRVESADHLFSDSCMIYKEEVQEFLRAFLFLLRVFCVFGVVESTSPLQFITIPAMEQGVKTLEAALDHSLDVSQILNSRSKGAGFGSAQKNCHITMDTFCTWLAGLGLQDELTSVWRQQLKPNSRSSSPSRGVAASAGSEGADIVRNKKSSEISFDFGQPVPDQKPSLDLLFRNAEERMLQIAGNRAQLLTAWHDFLEFSGFSSASVEFAHADRWIVQLFPKLDFAPALRRAFRYAQQHIEHKLKEQPKSKSPLADREKSLGGVPGSWTVKDFGALLVSVVYYRRM